MACLPVIQMAMCAWACDCGSWPIAAHPSGPPPAVLCFTEQIYQLLGENTQLAVLHEDDVLVI